jgi:hypothetical protein
VAAEQSVEMGQAGRCPRVVDAVEAGYCPIVVELAEEAV